MLIRSPQTCVVHQLAVRTIGGVISPGEVIILGAPAADDLTVETRIAPQDIDQLSLVQHVALKLPALHQRVTPELNGFVNEISADLSATSEAARASTRLALACQARS
ncbi:HlyD family efflux transporter periplasmic adaptor subunit [Mesorhizobium sp. CO1-1-11]|uniref:HlyD family efflux transporter periplasmic adaptor subunit n=1 Tax=Mesorhizobium sp. CO1-1-11 TaxID=2876636 RepID=UPI001CCF4EC2|nr:HlyD family efflux transporter periplasmic adaptor subunit [Mesorhizobium sp. CO1-1-11]MBZ9727199.1 HlyD family efflux transporter periplasmic adaptor subunit [Mesorhizobium sp. CO1-1-11]